MHLHTSFRGVAIFIAAALVSCAAFAQESVGNALKGKAKMEVLYRYDGPAVLPRPTQVVIQDFAKADSATTGQPTSRHPRRTDSGALAAETMQQLQDSFAKTLIKGLRKTNLTYERTPNGGVTAGPALVIQGEFTAITPGNSRARILVGFGRGASDLKAHVVISEVAGGQKTVLLACNLDSKSGKKPGALLSTSATGFAVGATTGSLGDKKSSTVQADASRMAKLIGKQTKAIMVAQHWATKSRG
jgi:hypothetical protein